jgi:hypothetical protein
VQKPAAQRKLRKKVSKQASSEKSVLVKPSCKTLLEPQSITKADVISPETIAVFL